MERCKLHPSDYYPIEAIKLTNYWYSPEADILFKPMADETAHEAAVNQMKLLEDAVNDDAKLKSLVDGFGSEEGDDFPLHRCTGKPIIIPASTLQRLLAHKKILCLFMARALHKAIEVDGFE